MRFALVILVLVLLLAYVGWHLWLLPPLPAWARWLVVALMLAGFGLAFLALAPIPSLSGIIWKDTRMTPSALRAARS